MQLNKEKGGRERIAIVYVERNGIMILKHKGGSNRAGHQGATTDADLYDNHRSLPLALPFPLPTSPTMVIVVTIIGATALASLTPSIPYQHPRVFLTARPFGTPPFVALLPL